MAAPMWPWPPTTGGLVRIAAIARGLARFCRVTLVLPTTSTRDLSYQEGALQVFAVPVRSGLMNSALRAAIGWQPLHCAKYAYSEVQKAVGELLRVEHFAAVYCHFIYTLQYIPDSAPAILLDQHNVDRDYWQSKVRALRGLKRIVARWNVQRVIAYENAILHRVTAYVSVSERDREATMSYASGESRAFFVAPNGVDLDKYIPRTTAVPNPKCVTLVFLGSFDLEMNSIAAERLCLKILPLIRQLSPGIRYRLLLIGRNPARRLRSIAEQVGDVQLTGTVPEVSRWLQQGDLFTAPLTDGAGTKLKILEAMACGLPVVGSSLAVQGLAGSNGTHYVVAETDQEFATRSIELAENETARMELSVAARRFVESRYSWDSIVARLAADISTCLERNAPLPALRVK